MDEHGSWTLGELTARVAAALAVGYLGQSSGRVRDLPDQRAVRWYTTLGLVDRPSAMRGRTALYGRRHLLQLVAIKRLQAAGRSLAEVQQELAAASDERLEHLADLPATAAAPPGMAAPAGMAATAAPSPSATPWRTARPLPPTRPGRRVPPPRRVRWIRTGRHPRPTGQRSPSSRPSSSPAA
jgi:DNA-binding transcriptional MerR regulator